MSLENKNILISGSSRGIGYEMAKYFAEICGSMVIVCSRHIENAKKVSEIINGKTYAIELDVTNTNNINYCITDILKKIGKIDILINNAGYRFDKELWYKNLHEIEDDRFMEIIDVDLMGSIRLSKAVITQMIKSENEHKNKRGGVIINISSTPAVSGHIEGSPYTIAKSGVIGLTKHIAREYGIYNIRAYTLALGNISTDATYYSIDDIHRSRAEEETSLKRWGKPEEVAKIASHIATDDFSYSTGNTIIIDGGTIMI
ncbi:MAG TPA: SDR family oxidoreductase [Nitrososphaeraceae archaeon]|nr:SDR family oxidoreductase [Nitrososphaeraceae archaeon]